MAQLLHKLKRYAASAKIPKRKKSQPKKSAPSTHKRHALHRPLYAAKRVIAPFFRWHFILLFLLTGSVLVAAFVSVTYITFASDITSREKIMNRKNNGIIIYDKNGEVLFQEGEAREYKILYINDISRDMVNATIAGEDNTFYSHPGISVTALAASLLADVRYLDPFKYGGSTITQQLVKNSLLGQEKSYSRKLREVVLALELERRYSKDEILEMYLNSLYYGAGAYGIEEAASTYFNTEASKVSIAQAAFLAALPNAPSYLSPYDGNKAEAIRRQQLILSQMLENNMITQEQYNEAKATELVFVPYKLKYTANAPHYSLWVRKQVLEKFGKDEAEKLGYRIYTTLDYNLQKIAEEEVKRRVDQLKLQKVTNGALVALDPKTGGVLAMVGSVDFNNDAIGGKYNVAIDGIGRQPGSSFKPFIFATAFEQRKLTPASILKDQPTDFGLFGDGNFKPKNYDNRYRGNVTVRKALANSLNIPAVLALREVGVENAIDTAERMGITTLKERDRYGLSLVLGGGEVHLMDMVQAYSVFATNGKMIPYYTIEKVQDKFGNTIYEKKVNDPIQPKQVMIEGAAYLVTNILADNNARSEVFGANSPLRLSRPAAAKTGTTDDYKDSWTMGYTPNLVAGAWIGNNDGTPMTGVAGAIGAGNIWKNFMERALRNYPVEQFTEPKDIVKLKTCQRVQTKEVRFLDDGTPYDHFEDKNFSTEEVFMKGTEPKETCQDVGPTTSPEGSNQASPPASGGESPPTPRPITTTRPQGQTINSGPDGDQNAAIINPPGIGIVQNP